MYVTEEAAKKLLVNERQRFLTEEWPLVLERILRLGLSKEELLTADLGKAGAR
jgi:GntR family transcriptional regulator